MIENIINLKMDNGINVRVDKGDIHASIYDIQDQLEDLFKYKKQYKNNETIRLSAFCNCMWDLIFCGSNKENREMSFKLC